MNYPFLPSEWTLPVTQSIYAGIVLLLISPVLRYLVKKCCNSSDRKKLNATQLIAIISIIVLIIEIVVFTTMFEEVTLIHLITIFLSALIPIIILYGKYTSSNIILLKLASAGIDDAIEEPTIEDYKHLLCNAVSNFSMLGVGADKITRDFDIFKEAMNRCASNDKPVKFLLVAPDVDWVNHGAIRRGLGDNHFSKILISSLKKIAALKNENGMPIEVRFYRSKPLFRMIFINDEECWFGYYSESVVNSGENEFENKSHTNIVIRRPKNKPPDRELYGAIEAYFNSLWEKSTDEIWDFKKYLS